MLTSQLLVMAAYVGRLDPRRRAQPTESWVRRLWAGRRFPPQRSLGAELSEHLCRDIGIEPLPRRAERYWPW